METLHGTAIDIQKFQTELKMIMCFTNNAPASSFNPQSVVMLSTNNSKNSPADGSHCHHKVLRQRNGFSSHFRIREISGVAIISKKMNNHSHSALEKTVN